MDENTENLADKSKENETGKVINPFKTELPAADISETMVTTTENVLTGELIRRERVKKGLDLTAVAKKLYIRTVYLEAIEKNDYNSLPEEPYTMGFVKSYAAYLELPVEKTVSAYKREMMAYIYHHLPPKELEDLGVAVMMPKFGLLLFALLVGIVVYLVWYTVSSRFEPEDGENNVAEIEAVIVSGDISAEENNKKIKKSQADLADALLLESLEKANLNDVMSSDKGKAEEDKNKPAKKSVRKSRIMLKAVEDTWVKIAKGNETLKKGVLKKGETFIVPPSDADEVVLLDTGNAAGIEIYVDKRPFGRAGKNNEVKHGLILDAVSLINKKGL